MDEHTAESSHLQAGRDADVSVTGNIVMRSGENRTESSGSNRSRGGSVGVGLTAGQAGAGLTVSASGNQSKGRENGSSLTNTERTISNSSACKEKYGDIPANGMLVREAIDRVLGVDVSSK